MFRRRWVIAVHVVLFAGLVAAWRFGERLKGVDEIRVDVHGTYTMVIAADRGMRLEVLTDGSKRETDWKRGDSRKGSLAPADARQLFDCIRADPWLGSRYLEDDGGHSTVIRIELMEKSVLVQRIELNERARASWPRSIRAAYELIEAEAVRQWGQLPEIFIM